ncbi:MAG: 5-formyltetrahydrofolate cyclo-ligase [Aquificaceae bacterium]|nr:5-formyltetrahydrofolate cyclo-ligase [Aquificaceae bacterium]
MKLLDKKDLRRQYIEKRESLSEEDRKRLSDHIVQRILSLPAFRRARYVLLFCPHRGEPDITPLFSWVVGDDKFLLLPRVKGDELSLIRTESPEDISPGAYCIPEPVKGEEVEPEIAEFSLIPGILFDRHGYRIGYGKGYYDRLLARLGGLKVGVCFDFQVLEDVPRDSWDRPVDLLVTDKKIYQGGKEK